MCCKKCWEAGNPWGSSGLNSPCGDQAIYAVDNFDTLALSQRQWTLGAPSTVSGGYLLVPDASVAHANRFNSFNAFASGTGDFVAQAELSYLLTGNPQGGGYNMFQMQNGIGGGSVYSPSVTLHNDATCRIDVDWAPSPIVTYTMTAGIERVFTLRFSRTSGTVTISMDGVTVHTIGPGSTTNFGFNLITFTTNFPGAAPLSRQRWKSFQFARC